MMEPRQRSADHSVSRSAPDASKRRGFHLPGSRVSGHLKRQALAKVTQVNKSSALRSYYSSPNLPSPSCLRYARPVVALIMGGLHVGRGFASKAVWLVGGGSDCRHGSRAGRVRSSRGTDRGHGASAITTARTAHGSANAAPRSSCSAGLTACRSSRRDVITFHLRGRLCGGGLVHSLCGHE